MSAKKPVYDGKHSKPHSKRPRPHQFTFEERLPIAIAALDELARLYVLGEPTASNFDKEALRHLKEAVTALFGYWEDCQRRARDAFLLLLHGEVTDAYQRVRDNEDAHSRDDRIPLMSKRDIWQLFADIFFDRRIPISRAQLEEFLRRASNVKAHKGAANCAAEALENAFGALSAKSIFDAKKAGPGMFVGSVRLTESETFGLTEADLRSLPSPVDEALGQFLRSTPRIPPTFFGFTGLDLRDDAFTARVQGLLAMTRHRWRALKEHGRADRPTFSTHEPSSSVEDRLWQTFRNWLLGGRLYPSDDPRWRPVGIEELHQRIDRLYDRVRDMVLAREIAAGRSRPVDDATIEETLKLSRPEEWNERTKRLEESRRQLLRLDENARQAWNSVLGDLIAVELGEHFDKYDDAWARLRSTGYAKEASDLCKLRDSITVLEEFARSDKAALVLTLDEGGELALVALAPDTAELYLQQRRGGVPSNPT